MSLRTNPWAFSPWGTTSSGWLAFAGANVSGSGANRAIRLDSTYTYSDVNTLRRYSVGDFITSGLAWTRPVHMEGAQIRSDFSMRPDLVTFPMPAFVGSAAVPSTVDILVDGNVVASSPVAAGPFETPQLPVMSGAGTVSMTVTNALGQQVTMTQPFYASSALLPPGLQTFSAGAGLVRRNWGAASSDYGKMAGSADYRRGLTTKFTVEGSVEGTPGAVLGGGGGVAQIGSLGVINFAGAVSSGSGHPGAEISAGAQRIGRVFSLGASAILANRDFRDVAAMNGDGSLRKQLSGFSSLSFRRFGSAGLAYAGDDQDAPPIFTIANTVSAQHSKILSASYSLQFRHMSIYASEFRNYGGTGESNGLQAGLTIPFHRRSSVDAGATSDGNGQVHVQRSAAEIGDWGYQGYISAGTTNHAFGEVEYKSPVGLFIAGIDSNAGQTTLRMESQGAISFADGSIFPSNTINDSFGIVDTSPMPHVHVFQENIGVGKTNSSCRLLVPDMRSFDLNHIAIATTDVPADAAVVLSSREIRPQDRSGVVVKFPIQFDHGALLRLVDEGGIPLPLGSTATLGGTSAVVPVGYDGDAYVENLGSHNRLTVERADGKRCTVVFDYRSVPGDIPSIGPLRCVEQER
ncbi:MAG TPA: fimbria/pilus outer membrane usher protein [Bryobacteraceae bacterium]